jgi:hypothetical protein
MEYYISDTKITFICKWVNEDLCGDCHVWGLEDGKKNCGDEDGGKSLTEGGLEIDIKFYPLVRQKLCS